MSTLRLYASIMGMVKLNAKQLRKGTLRLRSGQVGEIGRRNDIYIVLDNILDTYNVGSIFRLADAVAAKKVYLCGQTETPPNTRIKKASINTTEWVEWSYAEKAIDVIYDLRLTINDIQIVAIEQSKNSVQYDKFDYKLPICLVVGNETNGVSKEVLNMVDGLPAGQAGIVELPMFGVNKSLNVMVSLGIVLYQVISSTT